MATEQFTYKGRNVVINVEGDQIQMTIDDEEILVQGNPSEGKFIAPDLSFKTYPSVIDLAKDLVDNFINK